MVKVIMDVSALKDQKKGIVLQSTVRSTCLSKHAVHSTLELLLFTVAGVQPALEVAPKQLAPWAAAGRVHLFSLPLFVSNQVMCICVFKTSVVGECHCRLPMSVVPNGDSGS